MSIRDYFSFIRRRPYWSGALLIVAVTLLVYAVSLQNGFVLDDEPIIVKNPATLQLGKIRDVLLAPDVVKPYYRPLNRASYLLDYQLFGMNPLWFHAVNILIHASNALLLYLLGCRLLKDKGAALMVALLFAVHPANTEAVNFIAARNTLLSLFFSLASLLAFMKARENGGRWPVFSALLFFCGLLSKETALMLFAVLGLYSLFPVAPAVRQGWRDRMVPLVPHLAAIAGYFMLRAYSLHGLLGAAVPADGLFDRLAMNYHIIPQYVALLLFPVDLTLFHSVPEGGLFTPPWFFPVWLGLVAVVWLVVQQNNKTALFGFAWCVVNYLPISNIVPIPSDPITERFLYLPAVGAFLMLGAVLAWLRSRDYLKQTIWAAGGILVVFSVMTIQRNLEWKDDFSLFASGVRNNPASAEAHYNLGTALQDRGNIADARREWETALKLDPYHSDSLIQMGTYAAVQGNLQQAERYYTAALFAPPGKVDPGKAMAHYNLGRIYEKQGKTAQAIKHYELFLQNITMHYEEYKPYAEQGIIRLRTAMALPGNQHNL